MDEIKKEARKICEGVFDSMNELDTIDWYFIDNQQWKLGFRIDKDAPNKYSVRISGDGIHYSKTLNGLRPHILKKIEQILGIKRMKIEVAMKNKTCKDCKYFEVDTVSAVCEKKRWICDDDAPACNRFEKKITNGDKIRQMSNEELAEIFALSFMCDTCPLKDVECIGDGETERTYAHCYEKQLAYLNAPAEREVEDE